MICSYKLSDIVYALDLMHINPNNWPEPSVFVNRDTYYVPVETIDRLLAESKLNKDTRKEISDLLAEIEPADVNPTLIPEIKKAEKSETPEKDNETSILFKPYWETCKLNSNLNEPVLRRDFKRSHFAGAYPDKMRAVIDSLNATAEGGHIMGWQELAPYVPKKLRTERLPDVLVNSGFFYKVDGGVYIKPEYMKRTNTD